MLGGIFLSGAGVLAIFTGGTIAFSDGNYAGISNMPQFFGFMIIVIGAVVILGGASALVRRFWPLSMAGGVLAIMAVGPYFLGTVLGLIGLILVAMSRQEFRTL